VLFLAIRFFNKKPKEETMAIAKEEILQNVNSYCEERNYSLPETFKDNFAEHFSETYKDGDIKDANLLSNLKFNLDTAAAAKMKGLEGESEAWKTKEANYLKTIEELKKTQAKKEDDKKPPKSDKADKDDKKIIADLPEDVKKELDEFKAFRQTGIIKSKRENIITKSADKIREDLMPSFKTFVEKMQISPESDDTALSEKAVADFTEIFKSSIGDITPRNPAGKARSYEDIAKGVQVRKI
jgi:hypothetical protein